MNDLQRALYSAAQVRAMDRRAINDCGVSGYGLMQAAAAAAWQVLQQHWPQVRQPLIVCGRGNNGGDGYELARLVKAAGGSPMVIAVDDRPALGEAALACAAWLADGGAIKSFDGVLPPAELIVDALLGTGLSRAPQGESARAITAISSAQQAGSAVLAIDVPSGLDASTGEAFVPTVHADLTITFIADKLGLHTGAAADVVGELRFAPLDLPAAARESLAPLAQLQSPQQLRAVLPRRRRSAHKGDNGHVLVVGGNHGMMGAALLAARAALRTGAGLVSVATRSAHAAAISAAQPELMTHGIADVAALRPLLARADVIAIGPGLGQDDWAQALYGEALQAGKPLIVDADALNLLAARPLTLPQAVLTPHPGEAARLLGCGTAQVQADRLAALQQLEARYGARAVLKGAGTLISGAPPQLCPFGNPGMGVGGMGDVLTGIIAALQAQGLSAELAAQTGVLLHALAGDRAAAGGERGLLPSDLIQVLRSLVNPA